jgi:hypothetical protein
MSNEAKYDLIGDYPYEDVSKSFSLQFLRGMVTPGDLEGAGSRLEKLICPYRMGIKANQMDVALAVSQVLKFPNYSDDEIKRTDSRKVITNLVKNSADANDGKVDGVKIIRRFMEYRNQHY